MWGEKSSSSSSSIFFLGPLRACPAGAEVRWLQAGHTRKRLRLGSAKEPLRALPAPPSRNVCRCFSGQRTLSPAARGGRGRPSVILADELIHLPHKCHHPDAYRGWQGSFSAHIFVFAIIFAFVSQSEDEGKDYGKDREGGGFAGTRLRINTVLHPGPARGGAAAGTTRTERTARRLSAVLPSRGTAYTPCIPGSPPAAPADHASPACLRAHRS